MQHEESYIALAEILGPRSHALKPLIARFGTPEAIFAASEEEILSVLPGLGKGVLSALTRNSHAKEAPRIALWCHRNGVRILTLDDEDYPARLREIDEPPAVLYCRGTLPDIDHRMALGVVGPRKPDAYGESVTYKLSFELAAAGVLIVSGMAEGIDGIAAAAAIAAGGTTIAVLGCGIDITYPKHHTRLAAEIVSHGAILTEFAPGVKPLGQNFPVRNRLISALSGAVLLPEAGERSGSLITARYALLQGKTLFAVPGDVTNPRSAGTNRLLASGAEMALSSSDILDPFRFLYGGDVDEKAFLEAQQHTELTLDVVRRFGLRSTLLKDEKQAAKNAKTSPIAPKTQSAPQEHAAPSAPDLTALNDRQREIFALLPAAAFTVDALTERGVPVAEAIATLTIFEIYGLIEPLPGGQFRRK